MSAAAFDVEASDVVVGDSTITAAAGAHVFSCFSLEGGSLSLVGSLLESSADLGLRLLSLHDASLLVDRSLARADSGSGYMRLGVFTGVKGEIRSSKFLVSWKGDGTLFDIEDGGPAFRHDSVVADTTKGSLRFFDVAGPVPEIWNSILSSEAGGGELLRSSMAPTEGSLVADCIWGFPVLVTGAVEIDDLAGLDALNATSALYASRPHVAEPPSSTFSKAIKSMRPLSPGSACVGAALAQGEGLDFSGNPWPSGSGGRRPDIGADQLAKQ
jgi:hypothetical protein